MEDVLVEFRTASLANDCGFDGWCFGGYSVSTGVKDTNRVSPLWVHSDGKFRSLSYRNRATVKGYILAPTQSLLQLWLREVHGLQVYCYSMTVNGEGKYRDYVVYINGKALNDSRDEEYQTYESALEFGLQEALKSIKP